MTKKKLYALTDEHVEALKAWAEYILNISTDHKERGEAADAIHALTPMGTNEQIDAIASRAAAAERGPWCVMNGGDNETSTFIDGPEGDVLIRGWRGSSYLREEYVWVKESNAEFIAHAREDIPALLAEVERLRAELAKAREVTEDKVERVQKIMIDESFLAHEPDPHIRDVVREGIREQARLHVKAALHGGDDA